MAFYEYQKQETSRENQRQLLAANILARYIKNDSFCPIKVAWYNDPTTPT